MLFSSILGLAETKQKLIGAVRNNHLAHALLLHGPEGSANLQMALALATYLNCENRGENDACGACGSCKKMAKLVHPDVNFTVPVPGKTQKEESKEEDGKNPDVLSSWRAFVLQSVYGNLQDWIAFNGFTKQLNISKAASKNIIETLSLKSFEGGYKIIIIWSPEMMNIPAANTLLKILEEPPPKTLFLLVAHQPDQLLSTILSRTQKILVRAFTDGEIKEHLVKDGRCSGESAIQVASLADGNMREAYRLVERVLDENTARFRDWMRICYVLDLNEIVSQVDRFGTGDKEGQKALLLTGMNVLRECLLNKSQLDSLMRAAPTDRKFIEDFGRNVLTEEKIFSIYQLLNDACIHLERNASPKILFLDLSFSLARVLRKKDEE